MLDDLKYCNFRKDYSWQETAARFFMNNRNTFYSLERGRFERPYCIEVSPSGGKTIFSMKLARELIEADLVDLVIWLVPRNSIKIGFDDDAQQVEMSETFRKIGEEFIRIETDLTSNYAGQLRNHHGAVINYQALSGLLPYFQLLAASGKRLMFVFDEVHHGALGDTDEAMNIWGGAMEKCRPLAHAIVCMTGTPLRGDQRKVQFLQYESVTSSDGRSGYQVKSDFRFTYSDAVTVGIARKILCRSQDVKLTYDIESTDGEIVRESKPISHIPRSQLERIKNIAFCHDRGVVDQLLKIAFDECESMRHIEGDHDAAIIVVGQRDNADTNSLESIKLRIGELFGEQAITVESDDGPSAREAIRSFKYGTGRWIVAKEMIQEGTNLPRARVMLILRDIGNRTFYEQLVHRVTRNDADDRPQDAIIIQLQLSHLHLWCKDLEEQANIAWEKRKLPERGNDGEEPPISRFIDAIAAQLDQESVIIDGDEYGDVDPIGRKLHALIGGQTRQTRWQIDIALRGLGSIGIKLAGEEAAETPEKAFTVQEQINRYRDIGLRACRAAAMSMGGGDRYAKITAECKRAAGISGKITDFERDHSNPLEAIKKFADVARRLQQRTRSQKPRSDSQGEGSFL